MYYLIIEGDPESVHQIKQTLELKHYDPSNTLKYPKVNDEYDQSLYILKLISHPSSCINNINFHQYKFGEKLILVKEWVYIFTNKKCSVIVSDGNKINVEEFKKALLKIKNKTNV